MGFKDVLAEYRPKINAQLKKKLEEKISRSKSLKPLHSFYYEALFDFVLRGGKRLRPVSFIMAARGAGLDDDETLVKAACGVEFLHNSTLVHDDIMDMDELRRGGPTCHVMFREWHGKHYGEENEKFGESMAILLGDTAYTLAEEMLLESGLPGEQRAEALRQLSTFFQLVCEGQVYDVMLEMEGETTENEYLTMVNMKTGALFVAPLLMGASLGGADGESKQSLKKYGELMGQAFQIEDDIIGTFGKEEKTGKPTDSDIKEGKRTLLVIKALEAAGEDGKEIVLNALGNHRATPQQVEAVREVFRQTGSLDYSNRKAKELAEESKKHLAEAGLSEESEKFFSELADFVIDREV